MKLDVTVTVRTSLENWKLPKLFQLEPSIKLLLLIQLIFLRSQFDQGGAA